MLFSWFYYKIMKKPYMHTTIGSCGRDCVLIILFQLRMALELGTLMVIYSAWVSMTPTHTEITLYNS